MTDNTPELPDGCWYVVLHEFTLDDGRGNTRTDTDTCSMLHTTFNGADNALAYCQGMQAEGRRGSDGRYFIAKVQPLTQADFVLAGERR